MTLRTLFEKQVFVRLSEDHTAFICTTKWPLLSKIRRVSVDRAGATLFLRLANLLRLLPRSFQCSGVAL